MQPDVWSFRFSYCAVALGAGNNVSYDKLMLLVEKVCAYAQRTANEMHSLKTAAD